MRRELLLTIVVIATLGLGACTDAGRSLIILQNQVPNDGCVVSDSQGTFRGVGFLDVNSPGGYLFFPLVQNVAERVGSDPSSRLVLMQGADVEIEFESGFTLDHPDTAVTQRFSGSIEPDGGMTAFTFNAVSANLATAIKSSGQLATDGSNFTTMLAKVSVYGKMDGGTVESTTFEYPIQACDGCLKNNLGSCDALPATTEIGQGFQCAGYLQDAVIDCCTLTDGTEVCPAVPTVVGE